MTTTRYLGNSDFHESPPQCVDYGQFVGAPTIWERTNSWNLPDNGRCLECAIAPVIKRYDIDGHDVPRRHILEAVSE